MNEDRPNCYSRTRNAMTARDQDEFDGAREPMRALRDLIGFCEATMGSTHGGEPAEQEILQRAQSGFTALRKLFGDTRPADQIADTEAMIEPLNLIEALQLTAGALQCVAQLLPAGETHAVRFTGKWAGYAPQTIAQILDRANAAFEPKAEG